jgi:hypothetical protein
VPIAENISAYRTTSSSDGFLAICLYRFYVSIFIEIPMEVKRKIHPSQPRSVFRSHVGQTLVCGEFQLAWVHTVPENALAGSVNALTV